MLRKAQVLTSNFTQSTLICEYGMYTIENDLTLLATSFFGHSTKGS